MTHHLTMPWILALALGFSLAVIPVSLAESVESHLKEASAQMSRGHLGGAEKAYRRALSLEAGHPYARLGLATVMMEQNRLSEAARELQGLTAQHPDFAPAYYLQGQLYEREGKPELAKSAFGHYVAKSRGNIPPDPAVRLKLRQYGVL